MAGESKGAKVGQGVLLLELSFEALGTCILDI